MITTLALINITTQLVDNLIVADPDVDAIPTDFIVIPDPPEWIVIGTPWDGTNFILPVGSLPQQIEGLETL